MRKRNLLEDRPVLSGTSWPASKLVFTGLFLVMMGNATAINPQTFSDWSAPANVGPAINSSASEQQPAISPDGLSLYFTSNRTGGIGGFDIYVSHRASISDPWGAAQNVASLNTASDEGNVVFSIDGRLLFFQSKRPGGQGGIDIWFSRRTDPLDDSGWQPAVNPGPNVNSTVDDSGPSYFEDEVRGTHQLYFGSTRTGGPGPADIYVSEHNADDSFSVAALVPELNSPQNENDPAIRRGGLEAIFQSNRTGSIGGSPDLWVARRPSALAAWSTPVNLISPINTPSTEQNAYLTADGTTLFFTSDRSGGSGGLDIYFSTRGKICSPGEMFGVSPAGSFITINQADAIGSVVGTPVLGVGLNGIAFDSNGRLFASTIAGTSTLIQINPDTGALISTIGPINIAGVGISIGDLTFQPGTNVLFGVRSNADRLGSGGKLYTIDTTTGAATLVGDTGAGASGGIAFAPDGTLYQSAHNSNFDYHSLNTISPVDAHRIRTIPLTGYYDGLGFRRSDGILIGTLGGGDALFVIDSGTGSETFLGYTGQGVSDVDFRNVCGNQIDDAQFFVRQHYLDFLNRQPDSGGLTYWTDRITQCGSDVGCIKTRRIGVSAAFFIELEFQDTGYFLFRFYKSSYGRQPSFAEFISDRATLIGGSSLETNKQVFADNWVQRSDFLAAFPNTMTNAQFVNKLFDTAGLTAARFDALRQQEVAAMDAGRSRALILRDVIEIPDFKNIPDPNDPRYAEIKQTSQYNPAFVLMQYFGYLRRNVDQNGYVFWLDVVNNREPNNYHAMVCAFITSTEYQLRFGSLVTHSNAECAQ